MRVDIEGVLAEYGVPYTTTGRNVAKGHCAVKCPFCGPDDPSEHMGINLDDGRWGCWRNPSHRGRSLTYLLSALLGISPQRAAVIVNDKDEILDEFDQVRDKLLGLKVQETPMMDRVSMPEASAPITANSPRAYKKELAENRGFGNDWLDLANKYNLHTGGVGEWANRTIIPYYYDNRIVNYSGRLLSSVAKSHPKSLKYKTLSRDDSVIPVSSVVYRPPGEEFTGKVLVVTEGPFDALKVDYYGRGYGVRATCTSTVSFTDRQLYDLLHLSQNFNHVWVMYDRGADRPAYDLTSELVSVSAGIVYLPPGVDDPAGLSRDEIVHLAQRLLCESSGSLRLD